MSSFFYTNVDRGAKHYPIPHGPTSDKTVEILHNHRLLAEQIWPSEAVKLIDSNATVTTVGVESPTLKLRATFTSLDNGVLLQEAAVMGFGVQVQWTVVDSGGHSTCSSVQVPEECLYSTAFLEENVRVSCLKVVDRFLNFADDFNPKTKCPIEFLERVANGEISMEDLKVIGRGCGGTERLKHE
ncbi:hypothetical protein ABOM_003125 [Aspergillus bombycis]|uniref:Uncharacterized protein n=1 Tax=Aspergillus bombycis TaxID=109264 RepID=A0A1F8AC53_9EURO|nr:hypothetical protein ABOM_003125 [Aspergillus bombycis]OGM49015.1 hypothetical protein ABOM_003125 [Aspergillus bombycis]